MSAHHLKMMRLALSEARKGVGKTAPNPAVGCVIVKDDAIVGKGWHKKAGTPHAEVHALRKAGALAQGADVYVTLEPCSHFGKTPPCAKALIEARVSRVYVAMVDPNPLVSGRGIAMLREAGIEVEVGLLEAESRELNLPFIKWIQTRRPYVVLKSAITLDGKSATASGDSKWVTGDAARREVHRLRGRLDAIMVGVGTVIKDDPLLTCRVPGGKDPLRVIVDSTLRIPRHAALFSLKSQATTVIATCCADPARGDALSAHGVEVLVCKERDGRVDLDDLLSKLGERGVQSVLLEGGHHLAGAFVRGGFIDRCMLFLAPKLVGGTGMGLFAGEGVQLMADAIRLEDVQVKRIGVDLLVQGKPAKKQNH
ncbi:bifunctional diaminohydroxyphosphoribosylaminopyrimidine deaminase/5-amino-6-(5-phosphoribosylamino)uracil reductase RibD [Geomonas subterranea]|uniref:bifunctional diaminohydroxyphosphoribosylaminopyrimidine deaminase/5-amino-6-(5-phosphoribosylamino)uracil reductase RibD n=1 Tax=Geomonas subterranea TaxID=2847989 RepID=UPI001C4671A0|nr:bifunctional diaminohydroxyphosphoribosylaminopyrimidine deaminase/5-amino-6-(5-phosphoribosylamino)uracil reductase RibD [Geomonas subterranea]QXM09068.1 bifunctional diaminohydroxyphosphoribosylaminopyrimidine deaminase/5-amino-6-(5-phosphoribosylamino)uracil reductase RibD [Geomonas subterranea]